MIEVFHLLLTGQCGSQCTAKHTLPQVVLEKSMEDLPVSLLGVVQN